MPRFFFHVHNDIDADDEEGVELPASTDLRAYTRDCICGLICDSIKRHERLNLDHYVLVTNEVGQDVLKLTFREAFTIIG